MARTSELYFTAIGDVCRVSNTIIILFIVRWWWKLKNVFGFLYDLWQVITTTDTWWRMLSHPRFLIFFLGGGNTNFLWMYIVRCPISETWQIFKINTSIKYGCDRQGIYIYFKEINPKRGMWSIHTLGIWDNTVYTGMIQAIQGWYRLYKVTKHCILGRDCYNTVKFKCNIGLCMIFSWVFFMSISNFRLTLNTLYTVRLKYTYMYAFRRWMIHM